MYAGWQRVPVSVIEGSVYVGWQHVPVSVTEGSLCTLVGSVCTCQ